VKKKKKKKKKNAFSIRFEYIGLAYASCFYHKIALCSISHVHPKIKHFFSLLG
jgi:hypothetical protein